jgi:transcriptional regulator with PAS, ATPase and Fis domain
MTQVMQLRLLRVLQEMEFERIGDSTPIKVDVRVIAATNQDLEEKIKKGQFRKDLYYRLKVVEIKLPPLRERPEDITLLTEYFLEKFNKKFNKKIKSLSEEVKNLFMNYLWPGNKIGRAHV